LCRTTSDLIRLFEFSYPMVENVGYQGWVTQIQLAYFPKLSFYCWIKERGIELRLWFPWSSYTPNIPRSWLTGWGYFKVRPPCRPPWKLGLGLTPRGWGTYQHGVVIICIAIGLVIYRQGWSCEKITGAAEANTNNGAPEWPKIGLAAEGGVGVRILAGLVPIVSCRPSRKGGTTTIIVHWS
jgi:hypothetical protein